MTKQDLVAFLAKVNDSAEINLIDGDKYVPLRRVSFCAAIDHPDILDGDGGLDPSKYKQGPTFIVLEK